MKTFRFRMIATKYLGVDLQSTLSWKTHIDTISKKANIMLRFLTDLVVRNKGQSILLFGQIEPGVLHVSMESTQ